MFKLEQEKVFETDTYYHTGIKACLFHDFSKRMEEKISKGRRSLNVITKIGIIKRSLFVWVGYTIFWSNKIPILTLSCKLWILNRSDIENFLKKIQRFSGRKLRCSDIEKLKKIQRFSGRKLQRLSARAANIIISWFSINVH